MQKENGHVKTRKKILTKPNYTDIFFSDLLTHRTEGKNFWSCDTKLSMTIESRTLCDEDLNVCLQDTWEMNYRFYNLYPSDI